MIEIDKIYNMDCLEGMKQIPDGSVDVVITSPPYTYTKGTVPFVYSNPKSCPYDGKRNVYLCSGVKFYEQHCL